jgi:transcriptional regulator with PAS, ATPase and Fis domain
LDEALRLVAADLAICFVIITTDAHVDIESVTKGIRNLNATTTSPDVVLLSHRPLSVESCQALIASGTSALIEIQDQDPRPSDELLIRHIEASLARHQNQGSPSTNSPSKSKAFNPRGMVCNPGGMVWQSAAMHRLIEQATRAAQISDVPVLILGESGTGKQLLAQYIHSLDPKRSCKKLQSVNCSTISGTLAESMLFGHQRGAFTGASEARKGIFRSAEGGTVLLDEIGELDLALQPKLLHVLQEHILTPLGSDQPVNCDVRVIAATNRQLPALIQEGRFRLDLYQRLNVIALEIPPLRQRREDIPLLVDFFLKKYADYYQHPIEGVEPAVYTYFENCTLEGNIRQLENAIRQTLALKGRGRVLSMDDIPPRLRAGLGSDATVQPGDCPNDIPVLTELVDAACRMVDAGSLTLPEFISACEETALRKSLANATQSSGELADKLGVSRRTLYNKIRKYGLKQPPA